MKIIPKGWKNFQHYRDRCPPWIKLHRDLLNNYEFAMLPVEAKAIAPLLWLLAAESKEGEIDLTLDALAFRLHIDSKLIASGIKALIEKGFFIDASNVLAECLHDAIPEREREAESEPERESEGKTERKNSPKKILELMGVTGQLADDFIAHRRRKKAEITQTVMDGFVREAIKANISLDDAIRVSIERNWQSFKADWVSQQFGKQKYGISEETAMSFLRGDFDD